MPRRHLRGPAALALTTLLACFAIAGCEHDEPDGAFAWGNGSAPKPGTATTGEMAFVGIWNLIPDKGGSNWYGFFNADGTWKICDNPDGSRQRVHGTYRVSNGRLEGNMTNPGVGTGKIVAAISTGGILSLQFIEFWHEPHKTVTYSGSKL